MKKQLVAAGIVTAAALTGATGYTVANAATDTAGANPMSSLVQAIATKFNLKTSDVQAVFDEQKTKMDADREAEVKAQVAQLVKDGKLTQAQADKINAKRAELNKQRETDRAANQNLTAEQRKSKMEEHGAAMETWFKDNDIDARYRYLVGGGHGKLGGEMGFRAGNSARRDFSADR